MNCVLKNFLIFCFAVVLAKNVYTPVLVEANQKSPLRSAYVAMDIHF